MQAFKIVSVIVLALAFVVPAQAFEQRFEHFERSATLIGTTQGSVLGEATSPLLPDDYGTGQDTNTGVYCPSLTTTLQRGARDATTGGQVTELQIFLADYFGLNEEDLVTGYFGRLTQSYVVKFQQEKGLPARGIVGMLTREAIKKSCGNNATQPSVAPSCILHIDKPIYTYGETVTLGWGSQGVSYGEWLKDTSGKDNFYLGGDKLAASGNVTFTANVIGNPFVVMRVYSANGTSSNCKIIIPVSRSSNPTATTTAIKVTAPNGGEKWEIGQLNTITWAPYGYNPDVNSARDVKVELMKRTTSCPSNAKCAEFYSVGTVMDTGKASLHTYFNINDYQTWATAGEYYIKATNKVTGEYDVSDAPFTLLPRAVDVKVNGSDGPVSLSDNEKISVTIASTGVASCTLSGARVSVNGNYSNVPVAGNITLSLYAFAPAGGGYTSVSVTCYKPDGTPRSDNVGVNIASSAQPYVQVRTPNGGEALSINQPYTIAWAQSGVKSVSIALYKNDQWMKWIVKDLPPTDGGQVYSWTPSGVEAEAAPLGSVFKIYITGNRTDGTGYVDDKSDNTFSFGDVKPENPVVTIAATPPTIRPGQSSVLSWDSKYSNRCGLQYGPTEESIPLNGTKTVTPEKTTTYYIWCTNDPGTGKDGASARTSVTVTVESTPVLEPIITSFTISPSYLTSLRPSTYATWTTKNAMRCVLKSDTDEFSVNPNGSQTLYPIETTTYTLWCVNDPGTGKDGPATSKTLTVTVVPRIVEPYRFVEP